VKVTLVPLQMVVPGDAAMLALTARGGPTTMVMVLEVAGLPVKQGVALDVMTQKTWSPFVNPASVYVEPVPTTVPFFFHEYVGAAPPLTGDAVKVTLVPVQMDPAGEAEMLTPAGSCGLTVMVTAFEVAGLPEVHAKDEVRVTVSTSPLFSALLV
jgi:hypothetical protein